MAKKTALVKTESAALAQVDSPSVPSVILQLIELAKDPAIDVAKIDKLIDANERLMAIDAKRQFDQAFARMQGELPTIMRGGDVTLPGQSARRFSRLTDMVLGAGPVMARHGFSLRFTDRMDGQTLTVTGVLSHEGGHSEQDEFATGADISGSKNAIQAWGSARTYARRYIFKALLNLVDDMDDDDGEGFAPRATPPPRRQAPPARQAATSDDSPVTAAQLQRFHAIVRNSDRKPEAVKAWLGARYGYASSKDITRKDYEAICEAIAADGPLPLDAREPGSDDE